jgi:hypothetical protein
MPAKTRVLLEAVARGDVPDAMPEQAAQIAHLLLERRRVRIRVVSFRKEQRMPALDAHVFMTPVAIGEPFVMMLAEEARQRVSHPRHRSILRQVIGPAPAPPVIVCRRLEDVVVHVMPPHRARDFSQ